MSETKGSDDLARALYFEHELACERWSEVTRILKELNDALGLLARTGVEIEGVETSFEAMTYWSKYAKPRLAIKSLHGTLRGKSLTIKDSRIEQ